MVQRTLEGDKYVTVSLVTNAIVGVRQHLEIFAYDADCFDKNDESAGESESDNALDDTLDSEETVDDGNIDALDEEDEPKQNFSGDPPKEIRRYATVMLNKFEELWGDCWGDATSLHETRGFRNRRIGIPKKVLMATALDPRTKQLSALSLHEQNCIWEYIILELKNLIEKDLIEKELLAKRRQESISIQPIRKRPKFNLYGPISQAVMTTENTSDLIAKKEVAVYMSFQPMTEDNWFTDNGGKEKNLNPLLWWKREERSLPYLAQLARRILCIPATSASSERVFSAAGMIVTKTRSRIKSDVTAQLLYIKKNWITFMKYKELMPVNNSSPADNNCKGSNKISDILMTPDYDVQRLTYSNGTSSTACPLIKTIMCTDCKSAVSEFLTDQGRDYCHNCWFAYEE